VDMMDDNKEREALLRRIRGEHGRTGPTNARRDELVGGSTEHADRPTGEERRNNPEVPSSSTEGTRSNDDTGAGMDQRRGRTDRQDRDDNVRIDNGRGAPDGGDRPLQSIPYASGIRHSADATGHAADPASLDGSRPQGIVAEPVPEKRKRGRPKKVVEETPKPVIDIPAANVVGSKIRDFGKKVGFVGVSDKPMTDKEADTTRDDLKDGVVIIFAGFDWTIAHSNKARNSSDIWAIDDEDAYLLADRMLKLAKASGRIAYVVRIGVVTNDWTEVAKIIGPRIWGTLDFYAQNGGIGF